MGSEMCIRDRLYSNVYLWQLPVVLAVEVAQLHPPGYYIFARFLVVFLVGLYLVVVVFLPGVVHLLPVGDSHSHAEVITANCYEGYVEVEAAGKREPP